MSANQKPSHLPYTVRYVARLQERAAIRLLSEGKPAGSLATDAWSLRVAASLISQGVPLDRAIFKNEL